MPNATESCFLVLIFFSGIIMGCDNGTKVAAIAQDKSSLCTAIAKVQAKVQI